MLGYGHHLSTHDSRIYFRNTVGCCDSGNAFDRDRLNYNSRALNWRAGIINDSNSLPTCAATQHQEHRKNENVTDVFHGRDDT